MQTELARRLRHATPRIDTVCGVDFSGARLAGRTAWLAEVAVRRDGLSLVALASLESRAGSAERGLVMPWLVRAILASRGALWGIDAPFALPVEVAPRGASWRRQLAWVAGFGDATTMGRTLSDLSLARFGKRHVRRTCDVVAHTPFDCYHYRIAHQTFHAMRDVLAPLAGSGGTAVLPFDVANARTHRVVVEACPSSTLARLRLPRRLYKQPEGGVLRADRRRNRVTILRGLRDLVHVDPAHARVALRDPGGDALDAVVAAAGAALAFVETDAASLPARARREGWVYA